MYEIDIDIDKPNASDSFSNSILESEFQLQFQLQLGITRNNIFHLLSLIQSSPMKSNPSLVARRAHDATFASFTRDQRVMKRIETNLITLIGKQILSKCSRQHGLLML